MANERPRAGRPSTADVEGALVAFAEWRHLVSKQGAPWPGWRATRTPYLLYVPGQLAFLFHHPSPPEAFDPWEPRLAGLPARAWVFRGELPFLRAATAEPLGGRQTAVVPIPSGAGAGDWVRFVGTLAAEGYRAYAQRWGDRLADLRLIDRYPDLAAANNALGNVEGQILFDARMADDADLPALVRAFCLIRRERRGPMDDDVIQYEQGLELGEGLAKYVELRALESGSAPDYRASATFRRLTGADRYDAGPVIDAAWEQVRRVNLRAQGANRGRFYYTGMAVAFVLDRVRPGWQAELDAAGNGAPANLDRLLEADVAYDGGDRDERDLGATQIAYDYPRILEDEREFARLEQRRKQELLEAILQGRGVRITLDVSYLVDSEDWWNPKTGTSLWWDPMHVEKITENIRVHTGSLTFKSHETAIEFDGLSVVEDRMNKLFQVCLPKGKLSFWGDSQRFSIEKPAEFTEGLDFVCPGLKVRASQGYLQNADGVLYVKILR